jgi:hypothetical protein
MRPEADESTTRAMTPSMRPRMRPEDLEERMEEQRLRDRMAMTDRQDPGMTREQMERGSSAPGRSMRPTARPQRFEKGGMVTGSRAQISGTKFSGTF